jgi:glycosyltransferase involved in cell wall biosynthesis
MVAPERPRCGIADYARLLVGHMPADIAIDPVPLPPVDAGRGAWAAACARAAAAEVVHVHYETALFAPVKPWRNRYAHFMRVLGRPSLVTLHDHFPELEPRWRQGRRKPADLLRDLAYAPFFHDWEAGLQRLAGHCIVHTRTLAEHARAHLGAGRVSLLPMPIPETSARWQPSPPPAHLVSPGFVKPHKRYEILIDALAAGLDAHWTIAGAPQDEDDARYLEVLRGRIEAHGLGPRVSITGYLPRAGMDALLARASLAVFPFRRASGSSSASWAVAVGTPAAATDLPAFRDMVEVGAGLELLPADDPHAWAGRIADLLADPVRLAALAARNRAHAAACGFGRLAAHCADLYRRLAEV